MQIQVVISPTMVRYWDKKRKNGLIPYPQAEEEVRWWEEYDKLVQN
jgi:hypothetical protein